MFADLVVSALISQPLHAESERIGRIRVTTSKGRAVERVGGWRARDERNHRAMKTTESLKVKSLLAPWISSCLVLLSREQRRRNYAKIPKWFESRRVSCRSRGATCTDGTGNTTQHNTDLWPK